MANKYIGLHPNDLNRTKYGEIVLYIEGQPAAFFSGSGDFTISGSLAIGGIANVSASIAAASTASLIDTGSFMLTGSVSGDTITFTKGDGTTFQTTIANVVSASYASTSSYTFFAVSASYATTASYALEVNYSAQAFAEMYVDVVSDNPLGSAVVFHRPDGTTSSALIQSASYALTASYVPTSPYALTASYASTASYVASMSFDGNRPVTQPFLPDLVNYNPGTSTVIDFLEQIFYPDPGFGIDILSNEPFYILETELSGSHVRGNTVAGSPATSYYLQYGSGSFSSNTAVTWSLQPNSVLDINTSTGRLFMKIDLSGSATYQAPASIAGTVVATSTGGGFATRPFTVTVLDNFAPTINTSDITSFAPKAASFVTASGAYIGQVYISEPGDSAGPPTITTMGGPDAAKFIISQSSQLPDATYYALNTTQPLNSGSYSLSFTGSDVHGQQAFASVTFEVVFK